MFPNNCRCGTIRHWASSLLLGNLNRWVVFQRVEKKIQICPGSHLLLTCSFSCQVSQTRNRPLLSLSTLPSNFWGPFKFDEFNKILWRTKTARARVERASSACGIIRYWAFSILPSNSATQSWIQIIWVKKEFFRRSERHRLHSKEPTNGHSYPIVTLGRRGPSATGLITSSLEP
jgi:hypothetical protein